LGSNPDVDWATGIVQSLVHGKAQRNVTLCKHLDDDVDDDDVDDVLGARRS
jgi:hypothetical protein